MVLPSVASLGFLRNMMRALDEAGWEVHFAASPFNFTRPDVAEMPATHHPIRFPRGANVRQHLRAANALNALVGRLRPDLVEVHFSVTMLTAALARRRHWPTTLATVQGLRFPMQRGLRGLIETRIECWSARRMDSVTVLTDDDLAALERQGVRNARRQRANGFGCRLDVFDPDSVPEEARERARRDAGIRPGEKVFIFVGRKTQFKGYALVVRAFLAAQRELPELRLLLCGEADPLHPSGLTAGEQKRLAEHPQISTLGFRTDVRELLSVSDVNVFPSEREGMPVNLMESLAMGVPIITCDTRGCRDIVEHGVTGLIVPTRTEEAIAREMIRLASDDTRRAELAANALRGRDCWDRRHFVEERLAEFERLTTGTAGTAIERT